MTLGLQETSASAELSGQHFVWKDRGTWFPPIGEWLKPFLHRERLRNFVKTGPRDSPSDDPDWLDFLSSVARIDADDLTAYLADGLTHVTLRVYHGCRVDDAGVFHRDGLRLNNPATLAAEARRIVMEDDRLFWMRPQIDEKLEHFDSRERDTGRLYICADDRPQLTYSGHYCLYGSEWIQVVLGWGAHEVLRSRGVPTMLELNLPLNIVGDHERQEFASHLLQEWMHATVNRRDWTPELDFTFMLREDAPASWVVGHHHPTSLYDVFHKVSRRTVDPSCPHCCSARSG